MQELEVTIHILSQELRETNASMLGARLAHCTLSQFRAQTQGMVPPK